MRTREHFERIAQVFRVNRVDRSDHRKRRHHNWIKDKMWHQLLDDMCVELAAINPRFDADRFKEACNK